MVLCQVIGEEAGAIERLELDEPLAIEPIERHVGEMLNVIENAEFQCHKGTRSG
jgi:hypothetical protein